MPFEQPHSDSLLGGFGPFVVSPLNMYFYAISRRDLPTHQQAIQSAHAQLSFAKSAPHLVPDEHPSFVWLTVENKADLLQLCAVLDSFNVTISVFHDYDYKGYDPSAIACMLSEDERFLLSHLPLWKCEPAREQGFFSNLRLKLFGGKG